jgi:hypothetical protein
MMGNYESLEKTRTSTETKENSLCTSQTYQHLPTFTNIFIVFLVFLKLNFYLFLQIFAWKIADQLLHTRRDPRSSLYGAKVLREKIQFAFDELPTEAHISLQESMFNNNNNNNNTFV